MTDTPISAGICEHGRAASARCKEGVHSLPCTTVRLQLVCLCAAIIPGLWIHPLWCRPMNACCSPQQSEAWHYLPDKTSLKIQIISRLQQRGQLSVHKGHTSHMHAVAVGHFENNVLFCVRNISTEKLWRAPGLSRWRWRAVTIKRAWQPVLRWCSLDASQNYKTKHWKIFWGDGGQMSGRVCDGTTSTMLWLQGHNVAVDHISAR